MNNDYPDIIILYGVPKGEGLHGLTPSSLPKAELSPKEKQLENDIQPFIRVGIGVTIGWAAINFIVKLFNIKL